MPWLHVLYMLSRAVLPEEACIALGQMGSLVDTSVTGIDNTVVEEAKVQCEHWTSQFSLYGCQSDLLGKVVGKALLSA